MKSSNKVLSLLIVSAALIISSPLFATELISDDVYDMSLAELLNIEISVATKTKVAMEQAPSIVSVITENEIKNMGARDLGDILMTIPGIYFVRNATNPFYEFDFRGTDNFGCEKINVMLNGQKVIGMVAQSAAWQIMSQLPINNIKRIEIIRGPGSALYGAGAFLGVINIITKEGGDAPSRIAYKRGSYGTFDQYIEFPYSDDNGVNAYLYAENYRSDGYSAAVESDLASSDVAPSSPFGSVFAGNAPGNLTNSDKHYSVQTRINYNKFYLQMLYIKSNLESPVSATKMLTDENNLEYKSGFTEIGYTQPIAERGHVGIKAHYDTIKQYAEHELWPEETGQLHNGYALLIPSPGEDFPTDEGLVGVQYGDGKIYGAEITADYNIRPDIQIVGGYSVERTKTSVEHYANCNTTGEDLEVNGVTYPGFPYRYFGGIVDISENGNWLHDANPSRTVNAAYVQSTLDLARLFSLQSTPSLALTAGIRYDDYSDVGSSTNPRIGIVYGPMDKLYFKLLYGEAFRAPSFNEMYADNNPAAIGNPEIDPETVKTAEFLIGYYFTSQIKSNITFFHLNVEDMIVIVPNPAGSGTNIFDNRGKLESSGVEVELKLITDQNKYVFVNATFQDIKDTTNDIITSAGGKTYKQKDFFPGSKPKIYGNLGINYSLNDKINSNVTVTYIGSRERSEEKEWDGEELVRIDQRPDIGSATLLNASLTFKHFRKGLEIQLSGYNLLDRDYRTAEPEQKIENDIPWPGRSFMTTIAYEF